MKSAEAANEVDSLASDLAVDFQCSISPSEASIESFLTNQHFSVANEERVRRQFNIGFYPIEIEAYDQRRWSIHFIGLPPLTIGVSGVSYHVTVTSPPPTKHDAVLEGAIAEFVSQKLNCKITSLTRGSNPSNAASFFDTLFARQLSRGHEAMICDKLSKSFDATACQQVPGVPKGDKH